MRFLELNEIWQWCAEHGIGVVNDARIAPDESFAVHSRHQYASGEPSGRELTVARHLVEQLGPWDECLLWVVQWGIWESSENWPEYYAARGALGETRSLPTAPGLLVQPGERTQLELFVGLAMKYGWDTELLPVRDGVAASRRASVSHEEWAELRVRSA